MLVYDIICTDSNINYSNYCTIMEIINLRRIIPVSLQDEIHKCVSEFIDGSPYKIIFGHIIVLEPVLGKNAVFQVIVSSVCDYFKVSESVVMSKTRKVPFVMYRQIIMYFANMYMETDQDDIAIMMGHKKRSSISHGLSTIKNIIDTEKKVRYDVKKLDNILRMMISPR